MNVNLCQHSGEKKYRSFCKALLVEEEIFNKYYHYNYYYC